MLQARLDQKANWFIDRCKELGMKITPQRVAIYKELSMSFEHPSAEEIYNKIKGYYPNVSLTTVYRTLETFEKMGIISVVNTLYNAARYDANLEPHNHLICVRCKKVQDLYDESLNNLTIKKSKDYKILGYNILVKGVCTECQKN